MSVMSRTRGSLLVRSLAVGALVGLLVSSAVALSATVAPTDSATAAASSAMTITANGYDLDYAEAPFPDLSVTVSQTQDLTSQGILVSWTGGKKSSLPQGNVGGENFIQIAQCWGEDPDNPGHPDRTTCQYGALPNAGRDSNVLENTEDNPKNIAPQDEKYTATGTGTFDPSYTSIPFRASSGETVSSITTNDKGENVHDTTVDVNSNPFFTETTTNEIKWAGSDASGEGSAKFEIQTALQSTGLGCGKTVTGGDQTVGQSCWLVIIPRGTGDSGVGQIIRPGLFWDAWQHHIAFKLDFKPVGVRCEIGDTESQLAGSELIAGAITSWQPNLCAGTSGSAFVMSAGNESDPLADAAGTSPSALAFTSAPLALDSLAEGTADPLEYAPVGISGVAITFAIDRRVKPDDSVPIEYQNRETQAFGKLNLTPRLVAKLLTDSYVSSLPPGADLSHINYNSYADPGDNPRNLTKDPDFLAINDAEWASQDLNSTSLSDLLVPAGRSDLATQLWRYVLADADAVAFLKGKADPWGMIVNPWFSINAKVNPAGEALELPRDDFPKADPVEKEGTTGTNGVGPVNLVSWRPYTSDFEQGAYLTLRGDGQLLGGWDPTTTPPKYAKTARSLIGSQAVLGLTTAAAAERYQTVTASLLNSAGEYVAPTSSAMAAATAAMTPTKTQPAVRELDPTSAEAEAATGAYPLTMPVYAALNPAQTDATLRAKYANLIRYAVTDGQIVGTDTGQLPLGYSALPQSWVDQAIAAAAAIEAAVPVVPTSSPAPTTTASPTTTPVTSTAVTPAVVPAATTAPTATGDAAGALVGAATPDDPDLGSVATAVPAGLLSGLLAAAAVPLIPRIRRRF